MGNEERRLNRSDRLFRTILLLQGKPNLSSRDLAEHFGVSRRTIFRDLRALSDSGVPLTYGETGGYEILEGYQLPPLMLSAREAATLLVGVSFVKLQPDSSLRQDADEVGLKIRSVLPAEVKRYIDRLQASTVLDPYWVSAVQESDEAAGQWYQISEAVARQKSTLIEYHVASRDEVTRRQVDPLGLVYYTDHWNLIGYDHLRADIRNFRLDRITSFRVLNERFDPPEGFDLSAYLLENQGPAETHEIQITFTSDAYRRARRTVPARIGAEERRGDEVTVGFVFANLEYVANWLLRFGSSARVESPAALRALVKAEARKVAEMY